jgi:hypothetical protein
MNKLDDTKLIDIYAAIADLKEIDYKNTLVITALIELLVDRDIIKRSDIITKAQDLDLEQEVIIEQQKQHVQ